MLYRPIAWCARRALHWCYRDAHAVGHIPATGPVLLAVNHPNDLPDICSVLTFAGRRVTFVANITSAESRVVAWAYDQMGVIPVHRVRDARRAKARGEDSALANAQAFARVRDVLAAGGCVCVFPEGGVQRDVQLAPLRTGLARMALDARDAGLRDLMIVPLGLNYASPYEARSRLVASVGEPIALNDWHANPERPAAPQLTAEIAERLRAVTTHPSDAMPAPLMHALAGALAANSSGAQPLQRSPAVDSSQQDLSERVLTARVSSPEVSPQRLLTAWHSQHVHRPTTAWWLAPLAWCGLLLHAPAWWLIGWQSRKSAAIPEEIIPRRIIPGLYIAALWYLLLFVGTAAVLLFFDVTAWVSVVAAGGLLVAAPGLGDAAMLWRDRRHDRHWARVIRTHVPHMEELIAPTDANISPPNPRITVIG